MDVVALTQRIDAGLRAAVVPGRADKERAYLKSPLDHYGVPVPQVRALVKRVVRDNGPVEHATLLQLADALWVVPVHERRVAAVELLALRSDDLAAGDLPYIERHIREAGTWALVDPLATAVVGPVADRDPGTGAVLDRWAGDDDFWVRRSALLALLIPLRSGEGDFERFGRYADALLDEEEFFIRKAIGWVLRDTGRKRPDLVFDWLLPRAHHASGVTLREAVKPLSAEQRAAVLAAR